MTTTTVLCEKHSQAEAIATAMGFSGMSGSWQGKRVTITWASGHLMEMEPPDSATPNANWHDPASLLPLPKTVGLLPKPKQGKRLSAIKAALAKADTVWLATDPDREGEAIGRELLETFGYRGDCKRLWLAGGMDTGSVRKALGKLRDGADSIGMWRAQQARSQADYGFMYLTRAATAVARAGGMGKTLGTGKGRASVASVGRVQAPTLRLVYDREKAIANFKSVTHYKPRLHIAQDDLEATLVYSPAVTEAMTQKSWPGVEWQPREKGLDKPLFIDKQAAEAFRQTLSGHDETAIQVKRKKAAKPAPMCFALLDLQRLMSKTAKISASKTLAAAQKLYTDGHVSYPRTEHRELPLAAWDDAADTLNALAKIYAPAVDARNRVQDPDTKRPRAYRNKAMEHHGLMPTAQVPHVGSLSADERAVYEAIAKRYIEAHLPDAISEKTLALANIAETGLIEDKPTRFIATAERIIDAGWMAAFNKPKPADSAAHLQDGMANIDDVTLDTAQTKPPAHFTEDTLLAAMKNAARFVEGEDADILRSANGLGTPATRATVIDTLLAREYIARTKGKMRIREKGVDLIEHLPDAAADIAMTAQWESELSEIETQADTQARASRDKFIDAQNVHVTLMIQEVDGAMPGPDKRRNNGRSGAGKPTAKMLAFARRLAKENNTRLTKEQTGSFDGCRAFIDKHIGTSKPRSSGPSEKQIAFAESLADKFNIQLPDNIDTDRAVCKAFLDKYAKRKGAA